MSAASMRQPTTLPRAQKKARKSHRGTRRRRRGRGRGTRKRRRRRRRTRTRTRRRTRTRERLKRTWLRSFIYRQRKP